MKKLTLGIVLVILHICLCYAQHNPITKLSHIPEIISSNDEVYLKYLYGFPSQPCIKDSFYFTKNDNEIKLNLYYSVGDAMSPCKGEDSISLNKLNPGTYNIIVKITSVGHEYSGIDTLELKVAQANLVIKKLISHASIFPNPSKNKLFYNGLPENSNIQIINSYGQIIKSFKTDQPSGNIDISDLNNGFYFFIFNGQSEKIEIIK